MTEGSNRPDQRWAVAQGDIVGRDKNIVVQLPPTAPSRAIARWLRKLRKELETNAAIRHTIEKLQRYSQKRNTDGISGLEAKLHAAGRQDEVIEALEKKERFAKELERWSLYPSAQEILGHLLAKAEHDFRMHVLPYVGSLDRAQINQIVSVQIVNPMVEDCADDPLNFDHSTIMGMVYWLAEQCFVQWHKK